MLDGKKVTYRQMQQAIDQAKREGRELVRTDGPTTPVTDERTTTTDGQTTTTTTDGRTTVTTDDQTEATKATVTDGRTTTTVAAVETAEEGTGGESSAAPLSSAPVTPLLPRKEFGSGTDSQPSTSGCVRTGLRSQGPTSPVVGTGLQRKRVVGRKKAMVATDEDDGSASIGGDVMSITSADTDSSMASSSLGAARRRGRKRIRDGGKDKAGGFGSKEKVEEVEQEDKKRKKKREGKGRETPEPEEEHVGPSGEPKGVVRHALENMSSAVLGGAIMDWANEIEAMRFKSKNLQGRFSGIMKNLLVQIKEGTALLMVRTEAVGDSQFLRMRNTEMTARMKELERENVRLKDQARKASPGAESPTGKKRAERRTVAATQAGGESEVTTRATTPPSVGREEYPPLPQRVPRGKTRGDVGRQAPLQDPLWDSDSDDETETESRYTQQINLLIAARDLERDRKRKGQERAWVGGQDSRTRVEDRKRMKEAREGSRKKMGPRVISDVQVVPPPLEVPPTKGGPTPAEMKAEAEWQVATGGRRGREKGRRATLPPPHSSGGPQVSGSRAGRGGTDHRDPPPQRSAGRRASGVRLPKPPRSAAVTITGRVEDFSYATTLRGAREKIDLDALGIQISRVRKAVNGGMVIEIPGDGSKGKAEELTSRLREVLGDSAAVSCPTKKREIRVVGFDESVSVEEISEALSRSGGCSLEDTKVGPIRILNNGLGTVWAQLPVVAAAKVADLERIRLGWTVARVELLKARPLQCYRCWAYGHVQNTCPGTVDRRGACFKCGQQGHMASKCQSAAHCALCHDAGMEAAHRMGGPQCMAQVQRSTSGKPTETTT